MIEKLPSLLNSVQDIPESFVIGIYGCGETGVDFLKKIRLTRPDLQVHCFIDTYKNTIHFDLPVLKYSENIDVINKLDKIVIASAFWPMIVDSLATTNIDKFYVLSDSFIYENCNLGSLGDFLFNEKELAENKSKLNRVCDFFPTQLERDLYKELVRIRSFKSQTSSSFFQKNRPKGTQYIDFVSNNFDGHIIEVGAFDGADTIRISELSPKAKIISFEPFLDPLIKKHPELLNNIERINIVKKGLGSINGRVTFSESGSQSSQTSSIGGSSQQSIQIIRLDDYIQENKIDNVQFIKMDIEGGEIDAINGAAETIRRYRPQIAISIYHRKTDLYEIPLLLEKLIGSCKFRLAHYTSTFIDVVLYVLPK